jgi:cytochrome b561
MAIMLVAMPFIGVAMMASMDDYHWLLAIHRPLGIAVLVPAVIRLVNRRLTRMPPLPPTMSPLERAVASASEKLLYALMIALPLIGWGMLSAGSFPVVLFGSVRLPAILPAQPTLYALLRSAHSVLAYLLFAAVLAHVGAILFHTLVVRDRILDRMLPWRVKPGG